MNSVYGVSTNHIDENSTIKRKLKPFCGKKYIQVRKRSFGIFNSLIELRKPVKNEEKQLTLTFSTV